jgi:3-deoxy-manno-octulosonate cytidylyltransferase (CMP-KDO synthetase)
VGLYAYRAEALKLLSCLSQPAVEIAECLEQLRALHADIKVHVSVVDEAFPPGVDTEDDLELVRSTIPPAL